MIALHGFPPGRHVCYELWVALFFSLPRHRRQWSGILAEGQAVASSTDDLGPEWADAMALAPEQAEDWLSATNRPRMLARLKRKLHWG